MIYNYISNTAKKKKNLDETKCKFFNLSEINITYNLTRSSGTTLNRRQYKSVLDPTVMGS